MENQLGGKYQTNGIKVNAVKLAVKKIDTLENKRPVLGDLRNRPQDTIDSKRKDVLTSKLTSRPGTKEVKARVDTRWPKTAIQSGIPATRRGSKENIQTKNEADADKQQRPAIQTAKLLKTKTAHLAIQQTAVPAAAFNHRSIRSSIIPINKNPSNALLTRQPSRRVAIIVPELRKTKIDDPVAEERKSHSTLLIKDIEDIEDVDCNDKSNPLLVSEYVNDIYAYLYSLERAFAIRPNHLDDQTEITPKMRSVLLDWINEVHLQYRLVLETYYMTVSLIDRYLQIVKTTSKQNLQLVGITALFIAAKYEELYPPVVDDFVYITDETYSKKQILKMEQTICRVLNFEMGKPLPIHFLRRYAKAAKSQDVVHLFSKYLLELASIDYSFASYHPSMIAAAALLLSLKLFNKGANQSSLSIWNPTLRFYTTYGLDELKPIVQQLARAVQRAPKANLKNVYLKYRQSKFDAISARPELYGQLLEDACNF